MANHVPPRAFQPAHQLAAHSYHLVPHVLCHVQQHVLLLAHLPAVQGHPVPLAFLAVQVYLDARDGLVHRVHQAVWAHLDNLVAPVYPHHLHNVLQFVYIIV